MKELFPILPSEAAQAASDEVDASQSTPLESDAPPAARGSYHIQTWGCQMNVHDSERMAGLLESIGFAPTDALQEADVVLLNTCTVRENAAAKVAGKLGELASLKREKEHLILGVCGCLAQQEREALFEGAKHLDLVIGPRAIPQLAKHVLEVIEKRERISDTAPWTSTIGDASEGAVRRTFPKAFVTVQEGCDKFCTYCVVPFTRGREKCRSLSVLVKEARQLADRGFREIELLGQNVNCFSDDQGHDFADLITAVAELPGVDRLRFVTSHPRHFSDRIIEAMAHPCIANSLHLPVQCGSDRVLAAMGRDYTVADYMTRIEKLRALRPDLALQTDLIVGFPGETDEDFEQTMELLERVRFESAYSFKYSPRPFTAAIKELPDDIPEELKAERLARLQARQDEITREGDLKRVGMIEEILVDGMSKRSQADVSGRTSRNRVVNLPGEPELIGRLLPVEITELRAHSFRGIPAGEAH